MSHETRTREELLRVLHEQCWSLEQLSSLLQRQYEALGEGSRSMLEENTEELGRLNRLLRGIDDRRMRLLSRLAAGMGMAPEELTLTRLAGRHPGPEGEDLLAVGARLGALLTEVGEKRSRTRRLLELRRDHAEATLGWLRGFRRRGGTYDRDAELHHAESGGRLVDRIA